MTAPLNPGLMSDLVEKRPGVSGREVLRGTGLRRDRVDALCQEMYGMTFEEKRRAVHEATRKTIGRGRLNSWYIPGPSRGGRKADRDAPLRRLGTA